MDQWFEHLTEPVALPEFAAPSIGRQSYTIRLDVELPEIAYGVLYMVGARETASRSICTVALRAGQSYGSTVCHLTRFDGCFQDGK